MCSLLIASTTRYESFREVRFWLTSRGAQVLRCLYPIIPLEEAMDKEIEFDQMRALMRNEWETWDEAGPAQPALEKQPTKAPKATPVAAPVQVQKPMPSQYLRLVQPDRS